MKEYISPEMELVNLDCRDIIVTSDTNTSDETSILATKGSFYFSGAVDPNNPDYSDKYLSK